MKRISTVIYLVFCIFFHAQAGGVHADSLLPIPSLTGRVVDTVGTLTADQKNTIEGQLEILEREKGSQVVVLIVPTTQPEVIEQYTIRVVEKWKIGRKGVDDGVLLALAIQDRAMRIEVGYGLEGALTDARSKQILDDILRPHLREGNFFEGISAAVDAIGKVIRGEELPPSTAKSYSSSSIDGDSPFFLLCFAGLFIGAILTQAVGKVKASSIAAIFVFAIGVYFASKIVALICAVIVFILSVLNDPSNIRVGGRHSGGGGWSSGGGGFSGGGGSFGGGGSSGRW